MKRLSILGATGSIGTQCLDVIRQFPNQFDVVALSTHSNIALLKEQIIEREETRVSKILESIDHDLKKNITIKTQGIFGTRGYSIGQYAKIHRADLLIMNKPEKYSFLDKLFPQDIDYILSELPTDVLIIE